MFHLPGRGTTALTVKSSPPKTAQTATRLGVRAGVLTKRDERGAWQRRYCALVPQTLLFYYDDETSDDARGIIDLEYYGDVQIVRGRTLRLATASDVPLRSFFFQAETEEQAQKWCEALSRERYFVVADERDAYRELQGEFSTTRAQDDESCSKMREASQERNAAASLSEKRAADALEGLCVHHTPVEGVHRVRELSTEQVDSRFREPYHLGTARTCERGCTGYFAMPSILVSGPVRGDFASLFKAVAKAQKKGEFAAALCVGNFLGETREAPAESAPLPVYVVTGEDAIDADLASRLAAKNVRWLGRSGCEDVAGLRVGFLGGTYDEATYNETAPDDRSDDPHYTCDDVEQLAIDTGAYRNDGGCDVLLTSDAPRGCDAILIEDDPRRAQIGACSQPLGEAMRSIKTSYHFVAAADEGWSLEPYRCGVGGHRRLTRLHALPACGKKRWLRAFTVEPFASVQEDLDTEEGARAASVRAGELRAATANPYVVADAAASHKPPPGMTKHVPMAAAAAQEEDEEAAAAVLADAAPPPPPEDNAPVVASFPTAFGGRGQKTKHETQVVSAPRPVYTAPNRPAEAAPKEKKPKRQSIYANQNGGIANPKKGKRKRWGDPGGQF